MWQKNQKHIRTPGDDEANAANPQFLAMSETSRNLINGSRIINKNKDISMSFESEDEKDYRQ